MNPPTICEEVLEQAITWLVRLRSGEADAAQHAACASWRAASAEHESAWQTLLQCERLFELAPAQNHLAAQVLQNSGTGIDRRQMLGLLSLCGLAISAGWLASDRQGTLHTAIGERRRTRLADGSTLHLNTDTRVELLAHHPSVRLSLASGQLQIDRQAPDLPALRVSSGKLTLAAQDARFDLHRLDGQQQLAVLRGDLNISLPGGTTQQLSAGQRYRIDDQGIHPAQDASLQPGTWVDGQLVVRRIALQRLLAELSRYRHGWLQCAPELAGLPVSGVFQLDNIEQSLDALSATLPVRIQRTTRFWVRLLPA